MLKRWLVISCTVSLMGVAADEWVTEGFEGFRKGNFGNGGQNLYVSAKGILQRIHQTDLNRDGRQDLVFCNSQAHEELVAPEVYRNPLTDSRSYAQLAAGGVTSGAVADLNGDGYEDVVFACGWDGTSDARVNNSMIFYGSAEGITNRYVNHLPISLARAVAIGDFNCDGLADLAFLTENRIKVVYQNANGFSTTGDYPEMELKSEPAVRQLAAVPAAGESGSDLLLRREDGSYSVVRGGKAGLQLKQAEESLLPGNPDYRRTVRSRDSYTQAVAESESLISLVKIGGALHLAVFRENEIQLFRYADGGITGKPLVFKCSGGMAAAAGDLRANGGTDLIFACRDRQDGREYSWIYPQVGNEWPESERIALPTHRACDVVLADFSGRGGLDIVIGQNFSRHSYTTEALIFRQNGKGLKELPAPQAIPTHGASRLFAVKAGKDKTPHLVPGNSKSGNAIGDIPVAIYTGGPDGFHPERRIELPAFGAVDAVCADLYDSGLPDVVLANAAEMATWLDPGSFIYRNSVAGLGTAPPVALPTRRAHGVVCGDFNRDGYLDLAFGGFDNPELTIFYGSQDGFKKQAIQMKDGDAEYRQTRFMALADLNGDNWLDLIVTQIASEESFVLWGGPAGFDFGNKQIFMVRHACNAKAADLNGDGYPELLFAGHTQSLGKPHDAFLHIYWGTAEGYRESRKSMLPSHGTNSIAVADFNRDGALDVFLGSYESGLERDIDSYIYWNRPGLGFARWDRQALRTHSASGNIAADFNQDGWIDLAVANHKVYGRHIAYSTVWYNGPEGFKADNSINLPTFGVHGMINVDPGNIMDRSQEEYYVSEPYRMKPGTGIAGIDWDGSIPPASWILAQFRLADSPEELAAAPWQGATGIGSWFRAGQTVDRAKFTGKYLQYRLALGSHGAVNTPRISRIRVEFAPLEK